MSWVPQGEPGQRRYGGWAGFPKGNKEDITRCAVSVYGSESFSHGHQCTRPRGHGPNGEYCKQHDPAKEEARKAKWRAEFEAKQARWDRVDQINEALKACKVAIEKIADGHNDPRTLATETLKLFPT